MRPAGGQRAERVTPAFPGARGEGDRAVQQRHFERAGGGLHRIDRGVHAATLASQRRLQWRVTPECEPCAKHAETTLREAGLGYLWSKLVALVRAGPVAGIPLFGKTLLRVAVTSYCIPVVAVAPVLNIAMNGDARETDATVSRQLP